jgi:phospholipid/cholesterol/gamma-HCH transport system substrate-binding protein
MATLRTKFSVGLFLIVGVAIIIVGVVWFGMTGYLQKGRLWVAYFDESVQGLDRDSAVKYRGVNVGRVYSIGIAPDENLIEVLMQIDVDVEIESQIAAQLKTVGITGLVFIELDRIHDGPGVDLPAGHV